MSLWKRLKNLWKLSALEVPELNEKPSDSPAGTTIVPFLKKKQMAKIVEQDFLDTLGV